MMTKSLFLLTLSAWSLSNVFGFLNAESGFIRKSASERTTRLHEHTFEVVQDDDRVLDVASFRNGLVNPAMMVERAQTKSDGVDNTEAALNGLKAGLLYVGPLLAAATYAGTEDPALALKNYGKP